VAVLVARGRSNREIADALVIAESTAERHLADIYEKLSLTSRTHLVAWAIEHGLVDDHPR
jgi:DNA-binding NarL/FixJ family response regulator